MNPYVTLGSGIGTPEAAALSTRLAAWHDAMVAHDRKIHARRADELCDDECPHADARALWSEAVDVFGHRAPILEYPENAYDMVVGRITAIRFTEAESEPRQQRLAAERAVDSILADSFPASDPPSWTFGITRPPPQGQVTDVSQGDSPAGFVREEVFDLSRTASDRPTLANGLKSLAAAVGVALLVPFIMLLIGLPIVLAVRAVATALSWLLATFIS